MPDQNTNLSPMAMLRRVSGSAVAWSWLFNFLRLASGVLLLPMILRILSIADIGMYYVFLSLGAITTAMDFGFGPTIGRFVTYAMGGATKLTAHGLAADAAKGEPNYPLLWELLLTARALYRYIALVSLALLGSLGTFSVWQTVEQTSWPPLTWLAWALCIVAAVAEIYFSFWNIYLRNVNQVLVATQIMVVAYAVRIGVACLFLLVGGDLVSLPAASLISLFVIRNFSRRRCFRALSVCPRPASVDWRGHFRTIWPNTWRLGLYFAGAYLSTQANLQICPIVFGLDANAAYGLSFQAVSICSGLASVWLMVKWPIIGQFVARREVESLRHVFCSRLVLQVGTLVLLLIGMMVFGPTMLSIIGSKTHLLPTVWLVLMAANALIESHCSAWNTLIAVGNRLPMLWPSLATNAASLALNLALVHCASAEAGWLALGPLLAGMAFNYWYWPKFGARTMQLSWLEAIKHGLRAKSLSARPKA